MRRKERQEDQRGRKGLGGDRGSRSLFISSPQVTARCPLGTAGRLQPLCGGGNIGDEPRDEEPIEQSQRAINYSLLLSLACKSEEAKLSRHLPGGNVWVPPFL